MFVKRQVLNWWKLWSLYEDKPVEISKELDVDRYFNQNFFDISQSQHWLAQISKGSNKNSCTVKFLHFWDLNTQRRYILQEKVNIFRREFRWLINRLLKCFKGLDKATKRSKIPQPKTKTYITPTKSIDNLFCQCYEDAFEHSNRQICLGSVLKTTNFASTTRQSIYTIREFQFQPSQSYHIYKNHFHLAYQSELIESIHDV